MSTYPYDNIIAYEDRAKVFTHDWRFAGISAIAAGNTDSGMLFFTLSLSGTTYTCNVYATEAKSATVASGTVVSATAPSETTPLTITLAEANSSGLTGSMKIANYISDETAGYIFALFSVDADCGNYYGGYTKLNGFDATAGLAAIHNIAAFEIIDRLTARYEEDFGGSAKSPWWQAGDKKYPDLRIISNPVQLRKASAYYVLHIACGAAAASDDSALQEKADRFGDMWLDAMNQIRVAFDVDVDGSADKRAAIGAVRWQRG